MTSKRRPERYVIPDNFDVEPCYRCPCCSLWTESLQQLRDSIVAHVAGEIRIAPCSPDCLVCGSVDWQTS